MHADWCDFSQSRLIEMGLSSTISNHETTLSLNSFTGKICKAHKVSTQRSSKFRQISPGNAWQITAASIIVENSDSDDWCWGCPDNIFLLKFWKDFDPLFKFVLVYSSFETFLSRQEKLHDLTVKNVSSLKKRWDAYHTEMLRFYHKNQDRCLLLDIGSFENQTSEISQRLKGKFDIDTRIINAPATLDSNPIEILASYNHIKTLTDTDSENIFNELENSADIQNDTPQKPTELSQAAVEQYRTLKNHTDELEEQLLKEKTQVKTLKAELEQHKTLKRRTDELEEQLLKEKMQVKTLKAELLQNKKHYQIGLEKRDSENSLMLSQLHQVQEELEFYFKKSLEPLKTEEPFPAPALQSDHQSVFEPESSKKIVINFANFINGNGWHNAEEKGRWAGPSTSSDIYINNITSTNYQMEVKIIDGMSLAILENLQILINNHPLKFSLIKLSELKGTLAPLRRLRANLTSIEKPYPAIISATIPKSLIDPQKNSQKFQFNVSAVQSPAVSEDNDIRQLSLFYEKLTLTPKS